MIPQSNAPPPGRHTWCRAAEAAALLSALMGLSPLAFADHAIYTQSNASASNQILIFTDEPGMPLQLRNSIATRGQGTDSGLGSQSALVLSSHGAWLLAVNAGSNDISTFRVDRQGGLTFASRTPSGGTKPISLTQHDDLVYVLNAGRAGNITGFRLRNDGTLNPIPGSTRDLGGNAVGPAQVGFDRSGDTLVVTEKAANRIALYAVDEEGVPSAPNLVHSAGQTPFGFAFDRHDNLLVSEAFGGATGASAVSAYELEEQGLETESASVPTHQSAACWVVVTRRGRFAYATNTGSGTVTGYRVARGGDLRPLTADGISGITGPGSAPTDAALGGNELYVLTPNIGGIARFKVHSDGSLNTTGLASGVPLSAVGLTVRSIDGD